MLRVTLRAQARHNSSNVGGVTAGQVRHNISLYVHFQIFSNNHVPAPLFAIRENIYTNLQILYTFMKILLYERILCIISLFNLFDYLCNYVVK